MEGGHGPEFMPETLQPTDDGFSEAKLSKAVEGKGMDTKQVKKRKPIIPTTRIVRSIRNPRPVRQRDLQPSRKEKIVKAYKKNSATIVELVALLNTIDGINLRQEEQVIVEIKEKQHMLTELLNALVLEQRNQLTEEAISKEAWNLIK